MPSSIGSSGRPTPRIWKKWSMTQMESKPTSSACWTTRARVGPITSAPPGQVNELICRPTFIAAEGARMGDIRVGGGDPGPSSASVLVGLRLQRVHLGVPATSRDQLGVFS